MLKVHVNVSAMIRPNMISDARSSGSKTDRDAVVFTAISLGEFPDRLAQRRIEVDAVAPDAALFRPLLPLGGPARSVDAYATRLESIRDIGQSHEPGGVDASNGEHVEDDVAQGWPRLVDGPHQFALEVGRIEECDRRVEAKQQQPRNRLTFSMAFERVQSREALDFAQDLDTRP